MVAVIFSTLKKWYTSQTFTVLVGFVALLLMGNIVYLGQVRDAKSETADALTQQLSEYDLQLQHRSHLTLPEQSFRYGAFLKSAVPILEHPLNQLQIDGIEILEQAEQSGDTNNTASGFIQLSEKTHSKKKPHAKKLSALKLSAHFSVEQSGNAYAILDGLITKIQEDTGCRVKLHKADAKPVTQEKNRGFSPLSFELELIPAEQQECLPFKERQS